MVFDHTQPKNKNPEQTNIVSGNKDAVVSKACIEANSSELPSALRGGLHKIKSEQIELALAEVKLDKSGAGINSSSNDDLERNAVGAHVQAGKFGPNLIERKDRSKVIPAWETSPDGKSSRLVGFDEISSDGKKITWYRDGDKFSNTGADGKKQILNSVEFDKNNNGNMYVTNEFGQSFTIRGNGAVLASGSDNPKYKFDTEGRIESITPTADSWNKGAQSLAFSYEGNTDKLHAVSQLVKGRTALNHTAVAGESIGDYGEYRAPTQINLPGGVFNATRVHYPGTVPVFDDTQVRLPQDTKLPTESILHFNTRGNFTAVDGLDKQGRVLKRYEISPDRKKIAEIDPVHDSITEWTDTGNKKWQGRQVTEKGRLIDKDKGFRHNLEVGDLAQLTYKNEKGDKLIEYKDGRVETERVLDNKIYQVFDDKGRLIRAGSVNKNGPDYANCLAYGYDDKVSSDGKPIIGQVYKVHNGKAERIWSADKDRSAELLANGDFKYSSGDNEKTVLSPDLVTKKFQASENNKPELLTEISFADGSKRTYKYGNPPNPSQPDEVESSFLLPDGSTKIVTLGAVPSLDAVDKSKKSRSDKERKTDSSDNLAFVKFWTMNEQHISKDGKTETSSAKHAPYFALEVFSNGDVEATSSGSDNDRYLFPARGISLLSDKGIPVPLNGADGRVLRAQQQLESVYAKYILPEEQKKMKPIELRQGHIIKTDSIKDDPKLVALLAREYTTGSKDGQLNIPIPELPAPSELSKYSSDQLERVHKEIAYNYELAAAIIEGRETSKNKP